MGDGLDMFDGPFGQDDSELDRMLSFVVQCLPDHVAYSVAVVWMDTLLHSLMARESLHRVKLPDPVAFLRPIEIPCLVEHRGAGMAQPLCFSQIGFTASECLFRLLALGDVPPYAAVAEKTSCVVKDREAGDGHVALAAFGCRPRELEVSEW